MSDISSDSDQEMNRIGDYTGMPVNKPEEHASTHYIVLLQIKFL